MEFDAFPPILLRRGEMKEAEKRVWIWEIVVMVLLGLVMNS